MGFKRAQLFIPKDFIKKLYDLIPPKFLCARFFIPKDFIKNLNMI
jgi:hypothetical protein